MRERSLCDLAVMWRYFESGCRHFKDSKKGAAIVIPFRKDVDGGRVLEQHDQLLNKHSPRSCGDEVITQGEGER